MISVEMGTIEMSGQKCCGLIGTYRLMTWIGFNREKCDSETHGYTVGVGKRTNQNYVFSTTYFHGATGEPPSSDGRSRCFQSGSSLTPTIFFAPFEAVSYDDLNS